LWNYAQHFAMSDNSWNTNFGPSTPGAVNLVSGDTGAVLCGPASAVINATSCTSTAPKTTGAKGTLYSDADPYYDDCSNGAKPKPASDIAMSGPNIGTLLNSAGFSWGWFQGGFGDCLSKTPAKHGPVLALSAQGATVAQDPTDQTTDYSPHHEPFQYYASTANPHHLPPTSVAMVGRQDRANHQYDLSWFFKAAHAGNLPAVSFLKAPRYQDGHPGYSSPLDEQYFLTSTINRLEKLPSWKSTAVVVLYDDSDGWYDHAFGPILNQSNASIDFGCGTTRPGSQPGRCGHGPRLPLLVISPYAKANFVDNTFTHQSSPLKFIEDNWLQGKRISSESFDNLAGSLGNMLDFRANNSKLILNPLTGRPS
jgi:phospholipase C